MADQENPTTGLEAPVGPQDGSQGGEVGSRRPRKGVVPEGFKAHLFKKGESGNAGQRLPTKSISEALRWRLRKQPKLALAIADALFKEALGSSGSERLKAISMILERLEGSPEFALKTMDGVPPKHVLLEGDVAEGLER